MLNDLQIKMFFANDHKELQYAMNDWLQINKHYVVDVRYNVDNDCKYSAMIVYSLTKGV